MLDRLNYWEGHGGRCYKVEEVYSGYFRERQKFLEKHVEVSGLKH